MDEIPFLSNLELSQKLLRVINLKKEAASKRMAFYRVRKDQNDQIIIEGKNFESENCL